jgi:hypothetical protein
LLAAFGTNKDKDNKKLLDWFGGVREDVCKYGRFYNIEGQGAL